MEPLSTRPATLDDWQVVKTLRLNALGLASDIFRTVGELEFKQDSQWQDYLRERIEKGNVLYLVYAGQEALAMCGGKPNPYKPDAYVMHSLWVEPRARRTGAAKLMTAAHTEYARGQGYKFVQACCKPTNEKVLGFYRGLGYTEYPQPSEFRPVQTPNETLFVMPLT